MFCDFSGRDFLGLYRVAFQNVGQILKWVQSLNFFVAIFKPVAGNQVMIVIQTLKFSVGREQNIVHIMTIYAWGNYVSST